MDDTELKRLLNQFDSMRYARDLMRPHSIMATLEGSQRLCDFVMPCATIQRLVKEQQEHFGALTRIGDSFAGQFRQMQSIVDSMKPSLTLGKALMAYTEERATTMARLVDDMHAPYESVRKLLLPHHLKIGEVVKRFSAASAAEWLSAYALDQAPTVDFSSDELDEQLVELSAVLADVRATEAKGNGRLTWEQWLSIANLIMAILMCWYQLRASEATEKRLSDAIAAGNSRVEARIEAHAQEVDATLAELTAAIQKLEPSHREPPASQYVVIVDILRVRSKPEGFEIAQAHANRIVTVTDQRGRWLRVRYYDYQHARLVEGWCRKHHLQLVERIETQ